ncbi:MAG: radical SAM family heme chaperone HemW [Candidatus Rokubacteria bacterium]|nr:radical SAM family heme chaperone HemW [Candidatus Rokubacteria bacterium]
MIHEPVTPLGVLAGATPGPSSIGVYVHVPFCTKRCYYCAFNTSPLDDEAQMRRYVDAVVRELDIAGSVAWAPRVEVGSVFFGGGTPSLLAPDDLAAIVDRLRRAFRVAAGAEITVEGNPESVTRDKLAAYRRAGVDRISLGVQSLDDAILRRIGRLHDGAGARRAFDDAREAGFANVSVDLMYGLPDLDAGRWRDGVERVLDWQPDHVSAYGLSLDAGSLWGATGVEGLPPEEGVVAQYWALARAAAARGLEHYEISNYARPGFRSRHNLTYWRRGEYLAFGPGGAGFIGAVRYTNVKPTPRYCAEVEAGRLPIDAAEVLDARQAGAERLILGLRLSDGVPAAWLDGHCAADPALRRRVAGWRDRGLLVDSAGRTRLTEAGFLLSDALFVELV